MKNRVREYHVDISSAWQCVKRHRLMPLRGKYELDYQVFAFADDKGRLRRGFMRVFFDESRDDGVGFGEIFDEYGEPLYIEIYNVDGETVARIYTICNPAEFRLNREKQIPRS